MPTFWIAVFGVPALLVVVFAAMATTGGTTRRRVGRDGLATVLLVFGAATTWWNIMWGTAIWSLEGAWLWPLALVPLVSGALVLKTRSAGSAGRLS